MMFVPEKNWRLYKKLGEQVELGYISWDYFEKNFSINLKDSVKEVISQWESAGLLKDKGRFADLTLAGRFWAVTMVQLLINYLQHHVFASKLDA